MPKPAQLADRARALLRQGGALESTLQGAPIESEELHRALVDFLQAEAGGSAAREAARTAAANVMTDAARALAKTAGATGAQLSLSEQSSLEAIVLVLGRPALRYPDGHVAMPPSSLGENDRWRVLIATAREQINALSASVGRITTGVGETQEIIGTGWRIGKSLVVTNRHVVAELVSNREAKPKLWKLHLERQPAIDFAATDGVSAPCRFAFSCLAYCDQQDCIDFAVLSLAPREEPFPPPLKVDFSLTSLGRQLPARDGQQPRFKGREVYVVGHPYRLSNSPAVTSVYGRADGMKRFSPGFVTEIESDRRVFVHDCSTLGGNSGSCVATVGDPHVVVGLHFAAIEEQSGTDRASGNAALALAKVADERAGAILKTGTVSHA